MTTPRIKRRLRQRRSNGFIFLREECITSYTYHQFLACVCDAVVFYLLLQLT